MKLDNRTTAFSGFTADFIYMFTKTQLIISYDPRKLSFLLFCILEPPMRIFFKVAISSVCCHTIFIKHLKRFVFLNLTFSTDKINTFVAHISHNIISTTCYVNLFKLM